MKSIAIVIKNGAGSYIMCGCDFVNLKYLRNLNNKTSVLTHYLKNHKICLINYLLFTQN